MSRSCLLPTCEIQSGHLVSQSNLASTLCFKIVSKLQPKHPLYFPQHIGSFNTTSSLFTQAYISLHHGKHILYINQVPYVYLISLPQVMSNLQAQPAHTTSLLPELAQSRLDLEILKEATYLDIFIKYQQYLKLDQYLLSKTKQSCRNGCQ